MAGKNESPQEKYLGSSWRSIGVVVAMISIAAQLCLSCSGESKERVSSQFGNAITGGAQTLPSSVIPLERLEPEWKERFERNLNQSKTPRAELVFMGDSITEMMLYSRDLIDKRWSKYHPILLGISADRTQHLLWRIQHGEVNSLKAKVLVLLIGTNNLRLNTDAEIFQGIEAVVHELRKRLPKTKILVLGVLPAGPGVGNFASKRIGHLNQLLSKGIADGKKVFYLDVGASLLRPDGSISPAVMPDYLHPSPAGYELFFSAIKPTVDRLLTK